MEMTLEELGRTLAEVNNKAPRKKLVVWINLFGIQFHEDIRRYGSKAVIEKSGINASYFAELNKGMNLAEYVKLNEPFSPGS